MSTPTETATDVVEYGGRRVLVVVAVMLASLMQTLDSTIINVALPYVQGNLGASFDEATWVVTGFMLANVIVIPLTPWLSKRFGRKEYFVVSIVGFTIASALCGSADSLSALIMYRVAQGAFGGGLLAVAQPLLRDTFPPAQLGLSQAIFTLGAIFGPALGPALGGVLTDAYSWRWVFYINVVPGIAAALLAWFMIRNPSRPQRVPLDSVGVALLAVGLGALQYVLDEGERNDWFNDRLIASLAVTSITSLAAFIVWELRFASAPIVALRTFRIRAVGVGSMIALMLGIPMFGTVLMLPQFVTNLLGYTATLSGELILVRALPIAVFTPLIGMLVQSGKVDPRFILMSGAALTGGASIWQAVVTTSDTSFWTMSVPLMAQGLGAAALFVPLLVSVLGSTSGEDSASASSFINLFFQLGGSIASAILVTVVDRRADFHQDVIAGQITLGHTVISNIVSMAGQHAAEVINALAMLVTQQSTAFAYQDVFFVCGVATLAVVTIGLALPRPTTTNVEIELA